MVNTMFADNVEKIPLGLRASVNVEEEESTSSLPRSNHEMTNSKKLYSVNIVLV